MSSGYQTAFQGRLGNLPQNWGFLNPGSYMSTSQPFPTGAFANWKPAGEALEEGIKSGTQLGAGIAELPSDIQQKKLANVQQAAQTALTQAQITQEVAKTAGILNQNRPSFGQLAGQGVALPNVPDYAGQANKILGIKTQPSSQQRTQQTQQSGGQGGGNQSTPQAATNATGNTDAYQTSATSSSTAASQPTTAGSGSTPPVTVPETATASVNAIAALRQNAINQYIAQHPGTSQEDAVNAVRGDNDPTASSGFDTRNLKPNSDGRYSAGIAPNGSPVFFDPDKNDFYFYTPGEGTSETRYYSRAPASEWQSGAKVYSPQQAQLQAQFDYLNSRKGFDPVQAFGEQGLTLQSLFSSAKAGDPTAVHRLQSALDIEHEMDARKPLEPGSSIDTELNDRKDLLDAGNRVQIALNEMRNPQTGQVDSSQYNFLTNILNQYKDKYGSAPVIGSAIQNLLNSSGAKTLTKPQVDLANAFGSFMQLYRPSETGSIRPQQAELKAMLSAIGNPEDNNLSFAQRYGSALTQARLNYVDRIDSLGPAGYRLYNIDPVTLQSTGVDPRLTYADQLRPTIRDYQKRVREPAPVVSDSALPGQTTTQTQPNPSATPMMVNPSPQQIRAMGPEQNFLIRHPGKPDAIGNAGNLQKVWNKSNASGQ